MWEKLHAEIIWSLFIDICILLSNMVSGHSQTLFVSFEFSVVFQVTYMLMLVWVSFQDTFGTINSLKSFFFSLPMIH